MRGAKGRAGGDGGGAEKTVRARGAGAGAALRWSRDDLCVSEEVGERARARTGYSLREKTLGKAGKCVESSSKFAGHRTKVGAKVYESLNRKLRSCESKVCHRANPA